MRIAPSVIAIVLAVLVAASPAAAQLDKLLKDLPGGVPGSGMASPRASGLGDAKIGEGLKQALEVSTGNAVSLTGRLDGYLKNEAIKILLPEKLSALEKGLRAVGQGDRVNEFVVSMNRAAEHAAPAARRIFLDAIGAMTFDDARRILSGPDTAATEYFKTKTTDRLSAAFAPVVERSMNEVGVTRQYKELLGQAKSVPLLSLESLDLDRYVVGKSLDGLFHVVGEQERKIRTDPAARVTDLLRDVFGSRR